MVAFEKFNFTSLDAIKKKTAEFGIDLPFSENFDILRRPVAIGGLTAPNALSIHPMEGFDSGPDGGPGDLSVRRYTRYAAGGAGLLWFEACSVLPEGRSNPRQLHISEKNVGGYAALLKKVRKAARDARGSQHRPALILQLTFSGRYSKPFGTPRPIIAHHSPLLDPLHNLPSDYPLITDDELDALQESYVKAALLAAKAGFDGVDVKSCHRYLVSELLASFTRENSRYGGDFENRVRFLTETIAKVKKAAPGLEVTTRMNVFDAIPYPYGFGMSASDPAAADLSEPKRLAGMLSSLGVRCINVTIGNPYYQPHYGRPYDRPIAGGYVPQEHPLQSVERIIAHAREIQQAHPSIAIVGTGYSWLRQFIPFVAAGVLDKGWARIIGVGRTAFAYPDFARDVFSAGGMDPYKCCITCSACTQLMRDGGRAGCVPRDPAVYGPIYRERRLLDSTVMREKARLCIQCAAPTCSQGCPACVDIPSFIAKIADHDEQCAYAILRERNVLPETCSYVCPVEVQCESRCVQRHLNGSPVPIRDLQKYVCDVARRNGWTRLTIPGSVRDRRIAVIGAGPSGIACAIRLLEKGYQISIYDASRQIGGTAGTAIPMYRLSQTVFSDEVQAILGDVPADRIVWRLGTPLSARFSLEKLLREFAAVYVAIGLPCSKNAVPGKRPKSGVIDALTFLRKMKTNGSSIRGTVAVIGGGNTALDAAVTAVRSGASEVHIIYRRSFAELPAWPEERNRSLEAGVNFLTLAQPVGFYFNGNGSLAGLSLTRTQLGKPDESGRRSPKIVARSNFRLPVDLCIEATGQEGPPSMTRLLPGVSFNRNGTIIVNPETGMTARAGVFAGGDIVSGGETVVRAVADALRAAEGIDRLLAVRNR